MVQQLVNSIDWSDLEQRTNAAFISSPQHFLSLMDWSSGELINLLHSAVYLKRDYIRSGNYPLLQGKTLAMIFERPSLRTHVSFEMAMQHLGGTAIYIREDEIGLGRRESTPDIARVLGNYVHVIIARLSKHKHLVELAESSSVPVINGLTEYNHPCQAMADVLTIYEEFGHLEGIKVVYIGSSNQDVGRSLLFAAAKFGFQLVLSSPEEYCLDAATLDEARMTGNEHTVQHIPDPIESVQNANVIYTDVWDGSGTWSSTPSYELEKRLRLLAPYQINADLVAHAPSDAILMHCMPVNRDQEITSAMADSPQSRLFQQAANRLHAPESYLSSFAGLAET